MGYNFELRSFVLFDSLCCYVLRSEPLQWCNLLSTIGWAAFWTSVADRKQNNTDDVSFRSW